MFEKYRSVHNSDGKSAFSSSRCKQVSSLMTLVIVLDKQS